MIVPDNTWINTTLKPYIDDNQKFYKALQVAKLVIEMQQPILNEDEEKYCSTLAFVHMLVEDDKDFIINRSIPCKCTDFKKSMYLLHHFVGIENEDMYCGAIKKEKKEWYGRYAYYVLLAEIKYYLSDEKTDSIVKLKYKRILLKTL